MSSNPILVPVDLTETSPVAMDHACHIAERMGAPIHVLHLVDKEKQVDEGKRNLMAFLDGIKGKLDATITIHNSVRVGDILEDIGEEAEEKKARLVVIGTHGLQGLEYIVGTHAVRIINSAAVPFVVVQQRAMKPGGYDDIVVPIGLEKEGKQKLQYVASMARLFDSNVHLVLPYQDDEFLKNAQTRNLNHARSFFKERGIHCEVLEADANERDFSEATIKAAVKVDGDLIVIMNFHELSTMGLFGSETQDVIINEPMIPVLVMNPRMMSNPDFFRITA